MEIRSKREFYALWQAGVLGNRPKTWDSAVDAYDSGAPIVGFREVGKAGGGKFEFVPHDLVLRTAMRWQREGRRYNLDGGVPNHLTELQGEVTRTTRGLEGFFAIRSRMDIRSAMAAGLFRPYVGLSVGVLLRHFLDPSSYDDVEALLDLYPDAAIELAAFPRNVGIIPGRNTVIWEVRNY